MRLARYSVARQAPGYGWIEGDSIRPADGSWVTGFVPSARAPVRLREARLLAPVVPRTIMCVGRNYAEHAAEFGNDVPDEPLLFLKPGSSVVGPHQPVVYPTLSRRVDHEAEIAVVMGRDTFRVEASEALHHVFGYVLANDVTARDIQRSDGQWTRGKGFDTFCPIGPWVTTGLDMADVELSCTVNGQTRQQGRTRDLIFDVPYLVAYVSRFTRLEAGDVILTGTPSGVGEVHVGDMMQVSSPALGVLTNPVVAEQPVPASGAVPQAEQFTRKPSHHVSEEAGHS